MKVYNDIIDTIIKKKCPDLTYKLDILRVNSACIVTDWLFTFYVRAFPLDIVRYFFGYNKNLLDTFGIFFSA
jgi:hypothetical protein